MSKSTQGVRSNRLGLVVLGARSSAPLTWHGLTATYDAFEQALMLDLAERAVDDEGVRRELELLHELKATFDARILE